MVTILVIFNAPANHRNSATVVLSTGIQIKMPGNDVWGAGTRIGTISLTTTAVSELKVGSSNLLHGRHTLILENDTSGLFYIKNTTNLSSTNGFLVDSGTAATIKLDPSKSQKVYAMAFTGTVTPHVIEIRSS